MKSKNISAFLKYIICPHLVNDGGLQIHKHSSGHVLATSSFREEGIETVVSTSNGLIRGHLTIRLNTCNNYSKVPLI